MDWLECMEREFFTDRLDERLIDFLGEQGVINSDHDPDKWESFFISARKWREDYMKSSEQLALSSWFAWHINITLAEFSLPDNADAAEMMKKFFSVCWLLNIDGDDRERECYRNNRFDFEFECAFAYPKEKCARLSKARLVGELRDIYDRSYDSLCGYRKMEGSNPEYVAWVEPSYPVFMRYIEAFDGIGDLQAVRLNEFDCDQYVWYIVKDGASIYFVQISDFA